MIEALQSEVSPSSEKLSERNLVADEDNSVHRSKEVPAPEHVSRKRRRKQSAPRRIQCSDSDTDHLSEPQVNDTDHSPEHRVTASGRGQPRKCTKPPVCELTDSSDISDDDSPPPRPEKRQKRQLKKKDPKPPKDPKQPKVPKPPKAARTRKRFVCDFCDKEFKKSWPLEKHRRVHTGGETVHL